MNKIIMFLFGMFLIGLGIDLELGSLYMTGFGITITSFVTAFFGLWEDEC